MAAALAAQHNSRSTDFIQASEVLPQLAGCLALVRPVGMSEEAAAEWLAVAATELAGYSRRLVTSSLAEARRRCTHHGQIVPFVINDMEENTPWRLGKPLPRHLPGPEVAEALPSTEIRGLIESANRSLSANGRGSTRHG